MVRRIRESPHLGLRATTVAGTPFALTADKGDAQAVRASMGAVEDTGG